MLHKCLRYHSLLPLCFLWSGILFSRVIIVGFPVALSDFSLPGFFSFGDHGWILDKLLCEILYNAMQRKWRLTPKLRLCVRGIRVPLSPKNTAGCAKNKPTFIAKPNPSSHSPYMPTLCINGIQWIVTAIAGALLQHPLVT